MTIFHFVFNGLELLPISIKYKKNNRTNRDSLDIVRDILIVASVRVKKTRIMYQANLSFIQVKKYLRHLLKKDLLKREGDSFYLITEKGLEFLELYQKYKENCRKLNEKADDALRDERQLEKMYNYSKPNKPSNILQKADSA